MNIPDGVTAEEYAESSDNALLESIANIITLTNHWAALDNDRNAGNITADQQVEEFSKTMVIMTTDIVLLSIFDPTLSTELEPFLSSAKKALNEMLEELS